MQGFLESSLGGALRFRPRPFVPGLASLLRIPARKLSEHEGSLKRIIAGGGSDVQTAFIPGLKSILSPFKVHLRIGG